MNNINPMLIILLIELISAQEQILYSTSFDSTSDFNTWGTWCPSKRPCTDNEIRLQTSTNCPGTNDNQCVVMTDWTTFYSQQFDFSDYKDIRIEYDLYAQGLTLSSDYCYGGFRLAPHDYYATGDWIDVDYKTSSGNYHISKSIPDADNAPIFTWYYELDNAALSTNKRCWFDNFYIYGTPTSTPDPTPAPTDTPSRNPTAFPTDTPTANPTSNPSIQPTGFPTDNPTISSTVSCQQSEICQCPSTSECIFNCTGNAKCADTQLSTADTTQTVTINCIGSSACYGLTGDLSSATTVTWNCKGTDACKEAYLDSCGFSCEVNCDCESDCINEKSCGNDYLALINPDHAFTCNGLFCITPDPTISPSMDPSISPTTSKPSDSPISNSFLSNYTLSMNVSKLLHTS